MQAQPIQRILKDCLESEILMESLCKLKGATLQAYGHKDIYSSLLHLNKITI